MGRYGALCKNLAEIFHYICILAFTLVFYKYATDFCWFLSLTTETYWPLTLRNSEPPHDLLLEFDVNSIASNLTKFTILDTLVLKEGTKSVQLTYEDLVNISDKRWKPDFDPKVQLVYPQAFNTSSIVDRLLRREPIPEAPINGPRFRYLVLSKEVCHPQIPSSHRYNIVVVVKSSIANSQQRQEFRRIYHPYTNTNGRLLLGLRIGLVFSVGIPRSQQDNIFQRGKHQVQLTSSGGNFLNPNDLRRITVQFEEEKLKYDDLIVGDYEDTYFNLTTKSHYSFTWAATFCRRSRPTMLFVDDDMPFSVKHLARVVRSLPRHTRSTFLHGRIYTNTGVFRFEDGVSIPKWNVLKTEVPWPAYQTYAVGYFLLASFAHVERLALAMLFTQKFPVEDAWIGVVAFKLDLTMRPAREIFDWRLILTKMKHNLPSVPSWVFM
ncbi:UDP-GlcNAc:betaGal beta-1,3-N-acetylglucosaminyltransferase [Echinococcus granulosus]|uniref:Hexosyltransferase n=1 Tax=Echinococcus granulosus TaxID=6210 RepID=U6JDC1_ECHGR|nr:UDP-GlcNAc:betaGal beta-1,3-N-acetylglucosaminyltransferase [Echinococcus granulosus]EUB55059.1 UDP-GlcNAc:betaGal beta-1,3-N-acetylglucosaminyltransferase [Echinococcus granulosus]CDS20441.1 beta 13 n galactosyltransferase [Echinococcus granulosus]